MTLTQLSAFVFVGRLGSVKAAARALGVSEPAISQALAALRLHMGDALVVRSGDRMVLTEGGRRLFPIASQMVSLGAEAEAAVRTVRADRLHLVASGAIAEFVASSLADVFGRRRAMETTCGEAAGEEIPLLLTSRVADVALGAKVTGDRLVSEPVLRCRLVAVGSPTGNRDTWLVDPSVEDPGSDASLLLRRLRVPESRVRVFPNQAAAWDAAATGTGVAPAVRHLVARHLTRGDLTVIDTPATPMDVHWYATTLEPANRSPLATRFLEFLGTPAATQLMHSPQAGVPRARFRPAVHVSIWSGDGVPGRSSRTA
ncbi:LysR family transcriptional regulator [Acrocarpospora phusangensis]|uniref:LysR family transcriptional regulator n=1 Tax=Acrocarpospora phusangensis TaxID=1070424 RepID=A0A919QP06_9ACTN|nr:LysR family transcriptional regulator [Acrocarpospora phusangensis]GIH29622.1 LysR family transcriptional regulator [Acrocarpospora phusangensis]